MKIEEVLLGGIQVYLDASDCALLAEACEVLGDRAALRGEEAAGRVEAMEAALELAAYVGYVTEEMPLEEVQRVLVGAREAFMV